MKKALIGILPIIFLLVGCFSDPVKDDLLRYVNHEMNTAFELEDTAISAYNNVSGVNYSDDETMYAALVDDVIPNYNEFIKELNYVSVETDELSEIHEIYIEGADIQYNAFVKITMALEEQDASIIEEANGMLDEAKRHLRNYRSKLNKLADEHDVEWEKE
ncbi:hypothetical protein [Lentibacillus sp. Marseille-P4043]|uniref:hypothetical protein n=1 Tax=Lentibacillus sp. Marseille-P4043 TaxID=2040293 RepID=UPI000D0B583E|nr:hypothetical protein [Lentibacillus sp. Marseille-P4043]